MAIIVKDPMHREKRISSIETSILEEINKIDCDVRALYERKAILMNAMRAFDSQVPIVESRGCREGLAKNLLELLNSNPYGLTLAEIRREIYRIDTQKRPSSDYISCKLSILKSTGKIIRVGRLWKISNSMM